MVKGVTIFELYIYWFICVLSPLVSSFRPRMLNRLISRLPKSPTPMTPSMLMSGGYRKFRMNRPLCMVEKPNFSGEIDSKYFEFQRLEGNIYNWWESKGFFKPSERKDAKSFVIPMPPPNVTGYLHMGHAIFVALQDIMARFYRMKGYNTLWLPGTDHAGIATQLLVEKSLVKEGLQRKDLGRDKFLEKVWQWKEEKGGYITNQMRRLGASADWSREKFTLDDDMNKAVTEAFVQLFDKGLIYRGNYMVNWSPNLQTAVSDLEVDYSEEEGKLYFFKYMLADGESFIPVATTRPETILGDTAVCVHPEDERYKHMIGKMVQVPLSGRLIPVIADEYVDKDFGTGALKITPGHDVNDYELGKKHNLPLINILNKDATIIDSHETKRYAGLDRFICREKLWSDMSDADLVIRVEKHMQRVPRSQRGGEIIEPMVSPQWFVKMDHMAKKAVAAIHNKDLQIIPDRFEKVWFNWLENIHDWCISRQLWWGHRIPVYYVRSVDGRSVDGQAPPSARGTSEPFVVARSMEDALQQARKLYPSAQDLQLQQDEDVLDTWFSSGLWPFATVGWPNTESQEFQRFYPASVLETGYDILFFWVARMVTMGIELTGKVPFHTIYMHGLVRDGQGQKMSKTKGNVIDPIDTVEQFSTDALRYSLVTGSTAGQDVPLSLERIESNRNFVNKLWNAGKYIQLCVQNVKNHSNKSSAFRWQRPDQLFSEAEVSRMLLSERYIVTRLHQLITSVTVQLEKYQFGEAGRSISDFLWDDLADWYIEMSKAQIRSDDEQVRHQSLNTLLYVWDISLRLLHPYMPYITETLWQQLPADGTNCKEESLMVARWPDYSTSNLTANNNPSQEAQLYADENAVRNFHKFQALVRAIRNARAEYQVDAGKKIAVIVRASDELLEMFRKEEKSLMMFGRIEENKLEFVRWEDTKVIDNTSKNVHLVVSDDLEAFLPQSGFMDIEKERARLNKQKEKLSKELAALEGRLQNPNFASKAPANLVKDLQDKVHELRQQVLTVDLSLQALS